MTLRTLGNSSWYKIKRGEVFALRGCWGSRDCWEIWIKISNSHSVLLAFDYAEYSITPEGYIGWGLWFFDSNLYKLPKSVQRLWKTEGKGLST